MSKMPAIGKELYDHYALMSAQTHEALVKEYARYAVDIALSNVPRGAIKAADAARAQGAEVEPGEDIMKQQFELWFFRDMFSEQRLKLFGLFGVPIDDKIGQTHCFQRNALRRVLSSLTTPPAPQPTDRERVLEEALRVLEKSATRVSEYGAVTGPQWSHLTGALLKARAALAGVEA